VNGVLAALRERGFVEKTTDDEALERLFATGRVSAYVGFDPTADSLHVGSLVPIMALVHVERCGHRPIAVIGGGTGRVGDPSGKSEMRQVLDVERIRSNLQGISAQLCRYLRLEAAGAGTGPRASSGTATGLIVDNADWLLPLNYVEFLRDFGRHFSVNRMLSAESVKLRLESEAGLSFLEFNYSILQAFDFLVLHQRYDCVVQMGGSDQWGNIVAGIDLIRRVEGRSAYGITFPLITTAGGGKMGKTERGAVWLDASRTSPYEFYQFWVNTDDRDVGRYLRLFTLLDLEEVAAMERLSGSELRKAKEALAFEATVLCHGRKEAETARDASRALFGGGALDDATAVPTHQLSMERLESGIAAFELFTDCGLCESRSAARRLARQGGLYIHGEAVAEDRVVSSADLRDGVLLLRAGKKRYCRVVV
jgi:tyrosyl-tRNA synthetase